MVSNDKKAESNDLERKFKMIMAYFKVLSQNVPSGTEGHHEEP
jgi:hypothetical protein